MNETKAAQLEAAIRDLTRPINGQYPRPWMTNSKDPASSEVFVIGMNDAKSFAVDVVGSHDRYLDALFNRDPETCRQLFNRVTSGRLPTRRNIDSLVRRLEEHGVTDVLNTNVICYSTPISRDLRHSAHAGGAARGRRIFKTLCEIVEPKVMIVHGSGTVKELSRLFSIELPRPPFERPSTPVEAKLCKTSMIIMPSLAPPEFNKWSSWANKHLDDLCRVVAERLA